jgi:hypothetical protein
MSYQQFTDPGGGYGPSANKGYSPAATPSYLPAPTPKQTDAALPDFTYQSPIADGVGNYHANHFVAYFSARNDTFQRVHSIPIFYSEFCNIFGLSNIAKAFLDKTRNFKGLDVVKFTVGGNIGNKLSHNHVAGLVHDDWVAMQIAKDGGSFYGTTLKREWFEPIDRKLFLWISEGGKNVPVLGPIGPLLAPIIVEANKRHFLAGRRSWRVDFDNDLRLYRVETAAFERSSHPIYDQMEQQSDLLREDIIRLWTNMLENYANLCPIYLPQYGHLIPEKYAIKGNVAYRTNGEGDALAEKALLTPWFLKAVKRHPGLVADL